MNKRYVIKKTVEAASLDEALKVEAKAEVFEIMEVDNTSKEEEEIKKEETGFRLIK